MVPKSDDGQERAVASPRGSVDTRFELARGPRSQGLVDVLDRILDKGLVVAGDIRISLADVELLSIQIRLLVCSIDKAEQIGLDWWKADPTLSSQAANGKTAGGLHEKLDALESRLAAIEQRK